MRLQVLDGFRAVAVLGVLWAHIWAFAGNPGFFMFGLDVARIFSFVGTGVDLFFVISGFCMYLMYVKKDQTFTVGSYALYLKKRWLRIAPVFYFAVFVYALVQARWSLINIDWAYSLKNILFVRNLYGEESRFGPHFWSLATEWQFYMLLPLVLLVVWKQGFKKAMIILFTCCLMLRAAFWYSGHSENNVIDDSIFNRLIEFLAGIVTARVFLSQRQRFRINVGFALLIGISVAFFGRVLMSADLVQRTDALGALARILNLPVLAAGYSILILTCLRQPSPVSAVLQSKLFSTIGKYSYSMYVWHWIVSLNVFWMFRSNFQMSPILTVNVVFVVSCLLLFPISRLSYILFESFYFTRRETSPAKITEREHARSH